MHRSSSYYLSSSSSSSSSAAASGPSGTADVDQLPTYDPQSDAAKKEALDASRANLAHTLVHLVPVVVILCGLLLWSFSTAPTTSSSEVGAMAEKGSDYKTIHLSQLTPKKSGSVNGVEDIDPTGKNRSLMSIGKNNHVEEKDEK